jgi:hypothetical protein
MKIPVRCWLDVGIPHTHGMKSNLILFRLAIYYLHDGTPDKYTYIV